MESQSHIWNQIIICTASFCCWMQNLGLSLFVWTKMVIYIWMRPSVWRWKQREETRTSTLWGQTNIIYSSSCSVFPITHWYKHTQLYFHARREHVLIRISWLSEKYIKNVLAIISVAGSFHLWYITFVFYLSILSVL